MFRILRRIRLRREAGENTSAFWRFAIGEFVLVFLGILIALQVDNWNQGRKEGKLERILLEEMLVELNGDLEDINFNLEMQNRYLNSNLVVRDFLLSKLPWHDSLGLHFARLMGGAVFDKNSSAYESLQSIGIELISNNRLRQEITRVYTISYTKVGVNEDRLFEFVFDHLYPALREKLRTFHMRESAIPVNLGELRQDNPFLEDLSMTIFIYQLTIRYYQNTRADIISLIADIELELGLKPGTSKNNPVL